MNKNIVGDQRTKELKRFEAIVQNTAAGYFYIDKNGLIQEVNNAWVKLYKYSSSDEIIGKHFSIIQRLDDREQATKYVEEIMKGNESYLTGIFSRKCKDGTIGFQSFSAKPVFNGMEVIGLEGFILDKRRRAI